MKIIYKSIMMAKVDNDRIRTFIHVSCPILHFSHHIMTFPYLLAISIIRLNFGNPLIFVNMSYIYTLFLHCTIAIQHAAPLFDGRGRSITLQGDMGDLHNSMAYVLAHYLEVL